MGMSIRGYAKSRGCHPATVQRAVASGAIVLDGERKVDPAQADRDWLPLRHATRRHITGEANIGAAAARIAAVTGKVKLAKAKHDELADGYADRDLARRQAIIEARSVLDALRESPDGPLAESFAAQLGIDVDRARVILRAFIALVLKDVGDLEAAAVRDVMMA
jgi:hypothetical protein